MPNLQENLTSLFRLGGWVEYKNNPVPVIANAEQLSNPELLKQFEAIVQTVIKEDAHEAAFAGRQLLEDILLPKYPNFKSAVPSLYNRYNRLVVLLKFVNLSLQRLVDIEKLTSQDLIIALQAGINIRDKFQDVLFNFDDIILNGEISNSLGISLSESQTLLGTNPIVLKGEIKSVEPTIHNWLRDYLAFKRSDSFEQEMAAASFNRISYLSQNANVKKLSPGDRKLLEEVIKTYDWLRFGDNEVIDTSEGVFSGPKGLITDMDMANTPTPLKPVSQQLPKVVVPQPMPRQPSPPSAPPPARPPVVQKQPPAEIKPPLPKQRFNIQDVLNPRNNLGIKGPNAGQGVSLTGQGSGIDVEALAKEARGKRDQEQAEISKKLEDLKKRKPKIS